MRITSSALSWYHKIAGAGTWDNSGFPVMRRGIHAEHCGFQEREKDTSSYDQINVMPDWSPARTHEFAYGHEAQMRRYQIDDIDLILYSQIRDRASETF